MGCMEWTLLNPCAAGGGLCSWGPNMSAQDYLFSFLQRELVDGTIGKDSSDTTKDSWTRVLGFQAQEKEISREPHSSSDFSNFETESVHHTDKEIQADLDHTSNLEGSEYSYQGGNVEFKDMQAGIEFAVQITPIKDSKKHKEKMDAARETPGSSYFPDDMTEILDNKSQAEQMVITTQIEGNAMPPEIYPRIGEASSLERMGHLNRRQITTTDLDLEKMRLDGAMIRLKYRHEDNEKRRLHEEKMEQLRQKASSQSIGQQLHELFQPQNQYALFFFCFIFIHVIYTVRELVFYFITKHHIFCYAILLYLGFLKILMDYKQRKKQPWNSSRL